MEIDHEALTLKAGLKSKYGNYGTACKAMGIPRRTFTHWFTHGIPEGKRTRILTILKCAVNNQDATQV